jgi:hypothetical protein
MLTTHRRTLSVPMDWTRESQNATLDTLGQGLEDVMNARTKSAKGPGLR